MEAIQYSYMNEISEIEVGACILLNLILVEYKANTLQPSLKHFTRFQLSAKEKSREKRIKNKR